MPGIDTATSRPGIRASTPLRLLLRPDEELDDAWVDQTTAIVVHGVTAGSGR